MDNARREQRQDAARVCEAASISAAAAPQIGREQTTAGAVDPVGPYSARPHTRYV
jgi:hypothetical protein